MVVNMRRREAGGDVKLFQNIKYSLKNSAEFSLYGTAAGMTVQPWSWEEKFDFCFRKKMKKISITLSLLPVTSRRKHASSGNDCWMYASLFMFKWEKYLNRLSTQVYGNFLMSLKKFLFYPFKSELKNLRLLFYENVILVNTCFAFLA